MSNVFDEVAQLIDEVIQQLQSTRRTFTEREALGSVWEAGYEVAIQADARFVLAQEDWKHPSQWRLTNHTLANTHLLNDLLAGAWDGHDLDGKLLALDAEDQLHYVFCPLDPRLTFNKQGVLEPAERERTLIVPRHMKETLDALGAQLLTRWQAAGAEPWTIRAITEELNQLGWQDGDMPNAWLYVRSWLLRWPEVMRVGPDYWIPAKQLPQDVQRTQLHVLPMRMPLPDEMAIQSADSEHPAEDAIQHTDILKETLDENQVMLSGEATATRATWAVCLRTVHLLEGFLHVPVRARNAYPPPVPGEKQQAALRGVWFEDNTHFWLWLDRTHHHLYGPMLAEKLAWLQAGDILRIEWAPDVIVMRIVGHDEEVQREESRLVDLDALSALRGGLGESYRRSLQALLSAAPEGLAFAEVVKAVRERQNHAIHRGTLHALLYAGGFLQKHGRWFAAPDNAASARQLRTVLIETLMPPAEHDAIQPHSHTERVRIRVKAIHARLSEIIAEIHHEP